MTCDPNTLARQSSCLRCLTDAQLMQIKTYLLCKWQQRLTGVVPSSPSAIDITFASNENSATVTWANGATIGSTNELWKSTDGVTFALFSTVSGSATQAVDSTGMVAGNIWYYKVRACNGTNCSAFTSVVSASFNYTSPNVAAISFPTLVRAFGFFTAQNLAALTSVSLPALKSCLGVFTIVLNANLTTITLTSLSAVGSHLLLGVNKITGAFSLPTLVSTGGDLQIQSNTLLTSFSAPLLQTINGNFTCASCTSCTSVSMPNLSGVGNNFQFNGCTALTSVNVNSLVNVGSTGATAFTGCNALVNLSMPALNTCGELDIDSCTLLQTVSLPNLVTIGASGVFSINAATNPAMTTFSIPNVFFATDGLTLTMSGCALLAATVNQVLARGVASGVTGYDFELAGGTNAAPSGQGVADKATLIGLGNTVNTN